MRRLAQFHTTVVDDRFAARSMCSPMRFGKPLGVVVLSGAARALDTADRGVAPRCGASASHGSATDSSRCRPMRVPASGWSGSRRKSCKPAARQRSGSRSQGRERSSASWPRPPSATAPTPPTTPTQPPLQSELAPTVLHVRPPFGGPVVADRTFRRRPDTSPHTFTKTVCSSPRAGLSADWRVKQHQPEGGSMIVCSAM